jgi:predicted nucleic acid-binding protein
LTRLVVDASAMVEYLLGTPLGASIAETMEQPGVDLHAPALCDVEVTSALRALMRARKLGLDRAFEALDDYRDMPLARHGHTSLLSRMLDLRANFSAYDATYVALAEELAAALLTCDAPLTKAVRAHMPTLVLVRASRASS